ncbi:MAG: DUF1805 domain-containing protein [Planctomycetes bacterium]|nr:DUF1805 domain-containing protein [Planctomycetota bacterium]
MSASNCSTARRGIAVALGWPLALTLGCASSSDHEGGTDRTGARTLSATEDADPWRGLERHELQLDQKLLVVKGPKGVIGCPYLNVEMFALAGEACAIIEAIDTAGMLDAPVVAVSPKARELGIEIGMSGRAALDRIR